MRIAALPLTGPDPAHAQPTPTTVGKMDVVEALRALQGAARREQLLALGVKRHRIERALVRGAIVRYHPGCFALVEATAMVKVARALRAQLTCVSALSLWELPILEPTTVAHVAVPVNRSSARTALQGCGPISIHHSIRVESTHQIAVEPWVALDHLSRCASPLAQLVAVDAALNRHLITDDMLELFTATDLKQRQWLRRSASASAQSLLETIVRTALVTAGLLVTPQAPIRGVGRVDLLVERTVVVELDGRSYHSDEVAFATDRRRDRGLALAGYVVLRFTYHEVMFGREKVVADVLRAVQLQATR